MLADRAEQRRQRAAPALAATGQQGAQFASGGALVAGPQGQPGRDHALRLAAVGCQRLPGPEGVAGQRVLIRQQGDAGGTFGQHRVAGAARGLQVLAGGLRQLPGLQGELAGQAGLQRIDHGLRRSRLGGAHRQGGSEQRRQQQQAWTSVLRDGHRAGRYNDGSGQQLIAGT